ncbi:hypothetical protein Emed_006594 [Eimeria media]
MEDRGPPSRRGGAPLLKRLGPPLSISAVSAHQGAPQPQRREPVDEYLARSPCVALSKISSRGPLPLKGPPAEMVCNRVAPFPQEAKVLWTVTCSQLKNQGLKWIEC